MWVVKLGGSLLEGDWMRRWLRALVAIRQPVLVVPGGGGFADSVRRAQSRWGIPDATAHRMALLAMDQVGELMHGMEPRLLTVRALESAASVGRGAAVWLPAESLMADASLPADWTLTGDSIAAVAAARTGAAGLVLVKSAPLTGGVSHVSSLAARGIVDDAFPRLGGACGCPVWLMHRTCRPGSTLFTGGGGCVPLRVAFGPALPGVKPQETPRPAVHPIGTVSGNTY